MYRFALSRRWVISLCLAIVAAIACGLLSQWQWHRREERLAKNALIVENYDRTPVPLDSAAPAGSLPIAQTWTPVSATGSYLPAGTVLVRNRPTDDGPGYLVLVPFRDSEGRVILINRGWVPTGQTGAGPDTVPAPPPGQVRIVARLRPAERASGSAPAGQTQTITPSTLLDQLHTAAGIAPDRVIIGAYGELATEQPATSLAPVLATRPALDEGPHLSYALQWIAFGVMFLGAWVVLLRREAQDRRADQDPDFAATRQERKSRSGATATDEDIEDAQISDSCSN